MRNVGLALAAVFAAVALASCGGDDDSTDTTDDPSPTAQATNAPASSPTANAAPTASDLARGVVQIIALNANNDPVWSGSGTVVDEAGLILTNAHVVDNRLDDYAVLSVAVTDRTDTPPTPAYIAKIVAVDYVLDIAVVRVVSDLNGDDADFVQLPVKLGDSDSVKLGDSLQILGFPGIGGETITLTQGTVSGFNAQNSIATRAWIKTDATISGGNSGGLAANKAGEIIGIPTIAGSTEEVAPVDCRLIADTNRDGVINNDDTCVPIGGFINGLRPIALALPLIEAALQGDTYVSAFGDTSPVPPSMDVGEISFDGLIFSTGVTVDDLPTEIVKALPAGAPRACAFWDYKGMADGAKWEALWFVDGELSDVGSLPDQTWVGGAEGSWWVCDINDYGLPDGLYEVSLSVGGKLVATDSIYVGGNHPIVDVRIDNRSGGDICYVQFSPSDALNWGPDELGATDVIEPGQSWTFRVPASFIDLRLSDCAENVLAEEYELDARDAEVFSLN